MTGSTTCCEGCDSRAPRQSTLERASSAGVAEPEPAALALGPAKADAAPLFAGNRELLRSALLVLGG